jgi:hypothetical protein
MGNMPAWLLNKTTIKAPKVYFGNLYAGCKDYIGKMENRGK